MQLEFEVVVRQSLNNLVFCLRILVDFVSDVTFRLLYWNHRKGLPVITDKILLQSAVSIAHKIRTGQVSSESVVLACVDRIKEINSLLNCVVDQRFEAALEDARNCDHVIRNATCDELSSLASTKPFLGVPFSTKEGIRVKGFHHSYGLLCRKDVIATEDATAIKMIKNAGAIPLCVTNVAELGCWWESCNPVYGSASNPHSLAHSAGGSSGGEAALQASAGIIISIGSDTGGSIRTPAAFCGTFGHKPTPGIVPTLGADILDPKDPDKDSIQAIGPICRYAEDLAPLVKVLAGTNACLLNLSAQVFLTKLKYFYLETAVGGAFVSPQDPEVRQAGQRVVDYLENYLGIEVTRVNLAKLTGAMSLFTTELSRLGESNRGICTDMMNNIGSAWVSVEVVRYLLGRGRFSFPLLMQAVLERVGQVVGAVRGSSTQGYRKHVQELNSIKMEIKQLLGEDGVMISASHPTLPPYHSQSFSRPYNFIYTGVFNVLGMPATVVPLGLSSSGLPLSIQIAAAPYQDHLCLAVAKELERPFGGWAPPFRNELSSYLI